MKAVAFASLAILVTLGGCGTAGKPAGNELPVAQVASDVRAGAARSFDDCTWYPGAAGFSRPASAPVRPLGQLVLREDALLWGQYDMAQGVFKVGRRIAFGDIKTVWLARKADGRMLVLESMDGTLDSFAIEHPGKVKGGAVEADGGATEEAWRFLRGALGI